MKAKCLLIPTKSVAGIVIGASVIDYRRHFGKLVKASSRHDWFYDTYLLKDIPVELWVDQKGKIVSIYCDKSCIYADTELIGLTLQKLKHLFSEVVFDIESMYVIRNGRDQKQQVLNSDKMGLMIWLYRRRVVNVICTRY